MGGNSAIIVSKTVTYYVAYQARYVYECFARFSLSLFVIVLVDF